MQKCNECIQVTALFHFIGATLLTNHTEKKKRKHTTTKGACDRPPHTTLTFRPSMSTGNNSSYINDDDQNRIVFNSLFSFSNHSRTPKPYSKRNLPNSFYRPPSINTKNKNVHRQHTKSQSSLPENSIHMKSTKNSSHSRTVSDTAVLTEQSSLSQINSQTSMLPLPDDWEEKQTSDGQIYYIE